MTKQDTSTDPDVAEAIADYRKTQRNFRLVAAIAFAVVVIGAIFYHHTEMLSWVDAFYFCVITLTTIGYGDIVPHTDPGKIFTIFYVLTGIGIIATFANLLLKNAFLRRQLKNKKRESASATIRDGIELD